MEQYIDEYLRNVFGEPLLEEKKSTGKPDVVSRTIGLAKKGVEKVGTGVEKASGAVKKFSTKHPLAVGAMALGAGALAYKRYLSAAARACAQYSGTRKTQCIQRYKSGGMRAEILSLKENCIICLESPDRELCLEIVKLRISELRQEIEKLK